MVNQTSSRVTCVSDLCLEAKRSSTTHSAICSLTSLMEDPEFMVRAAGVKALSNIARNGVLEE